MRLPYFPPRHDRTCPPCHVPRPSCKMTISGGAAITLRDYLANLSTKMPLRRKVRLLARNTAIRVKYRQTCCGHPGEPGC